MAQQSLLGKDQRFPAQNSLLLTGFDERLQSLMAQDPAPVCSITDIAEVVRSLIGSLEGGLVADDLQLYQEIEGLADFIRSARAEIVALNPADIREEFLPSATDELDAIVQATEQATGCIMDATEAIEDVSGRVGGDDAELLQGAVTGIYEACSFQDITGQRITKVVRMLKSIETRVDALVSAFAPQSGLRASALLEKADGVAHPQDDSLQHAGNFGRSSVQAVGDRAEDSALLNGPQSSDEAMGQDDIDALLKGFD